MNALSIPAVRYPRGRLMRFVVDQNPFYLLSALCMLGGLLTLTNSLSFSPIPQRHLLLLIGTLNVYELLLVGLALWLIAGRGLVRDGSILLAIEAAFLADTAMLNAELFTVDRRLGAIVNLILLLLAAAKLALIFRVLKVRSVGAYVLILVNLFVLFALPGIFKQVSLRDNGRVAALAIYVAWWAVGLLPIGFAFVFHRPDTRLASSRDRRPKAHAPLVLTFLAFAFASILVHLRLSNWVYQVGWEWSNLTPLLLGLAVCAGMVDSHVHTLAMRLRTQLALPIFAIALSLRFSPQMVIWIGPVGLSPMRLAFAGAAAVYLQGFLLHRHVYFAMACAICTAAIGFGASPAMAQQNITILWNWLVNACRRFQPRTASDWGLLSVIASFVLLVLGAAVSLLKVPNASSNDSDAPPVPPVQV